MLRVILRHTRNAFLFACCVLLLCSFHRLWRYDFDDQHNNHPTSSSQEGDVLLEDHFVFWDGIPAWERSLEARSNNHAVLSKLMSYTNLNYAILLAFKRHNNNNNSPSVESASTSSDRTTATTRDRVPESAVLVEKPAMTATTSIVSKEDAVTVPRPKQQHDSEKDTQQESITTTTSEKEDDEKQQTGPPTTTTSTSTIKSTQEETPTATPRPLEEAKIIFKRQIRHGKQRQTRKKKSHKHKQTKVPDASTPQDNTHTTNPPLPPSTTSNAPKIGFILHLPSCDRDAIASWIATWNEQALDQPFLFHVLLGPNVSKTCLEQLQVRLSQLNNHHRDGMMVFQVSQDAPLALALQTCQDNLLEQHAKILSSVVVLDELLYYDHSKAKGRLRSSAMMRRFTTRDNKSVFTCTGGGQQQPSFCDDSVLECPWFQYSPSNNNNPESPPDRTETPKVEAAVL